MKNYQRLSASTLIALAAFSTTLIAGSPTIQPPSIQTTIAPSGALTNGQLATRANKLFVTGSFKRALGQDIPAAAHVDVSIFAADGSLLAERQDDIRSSHPRLSRGRTGRIPFVVSFPRGLAASASIVRIAYHPEPHF